MIRKVTTDKLSRRFYIFQRIETHETSSKPSETPSFDVDKLIPDLEELVAKGIKSSKGKEPLASMKNVISHLLNFISQRPFWSPWCIVFSCLASH